MAKFEKYSDLLKEEKRLENELELATERLQEKFTFNPIQSLKSSISRFFSPSKDSISSGFVVEPENRREQLTGLVLDLAYQAITVAVSKRINAKTAGKSSETIAALTLVVKSIVDDLYQTNKPKMTEFVNLIGDKILSKIATDSELDEEES